ncbi:unnamed protein product [Mytilus coruscus]|uniref:Reverse transcriptase zinc-binding domain-containing protein n=1 Tax=Mytilus coruscus TaxID=42192 RepID=A0A6J8ERQ6_MYTCO|nr:unnamed protein product [Mytilus coruscus]
MSDFEQKWNEDLHSDTTRRNGPGGNKIRTYRTFKHDVYTELYLNKLIPSHRRAYSIRLETGRYESLPIDQRTCFVCDDKIETEELVLTECPLYGDLRDELYKILNFENENFSLWPNSVKFLANDNINVIQKSAKTCKTVGDVFFIPIIDVNLFYDLTFVL